MKKLALVLLAPAFALALASALAPASASARETIGIFGDWGAFRDKRGSTVCYIVSAPTSSIGKGRSAPQLVVSKWQRPSSVQVMAGMGTTVRNVSAKVGGAGFQLTARGESAWLPDSAGDAAMLSALLSASRATVEGRTSRGNRFSDSYSLAGFADAWAAAQKACR